MASSSSLPDPALPAPPLSEDDVGFTAEQLIARQRELEEAAREAVPFSFLKGGCTYEKGYIRQPVYACRTCGGGGVCAGCSVGCHADHDLIELFAKRAFRCDCGTLSLSRGDENKEKILPPCNLRSKDLNYAPENDENRYCKNFKGEFCRCERGKTYNPETEEETMFQCLVCENWVHESCSSLRPGKDMDDIDNPNRDLADGPLVDYDSFDLFICSDCVCKPGGEVLKLYLGHRGWIVCLPTGPGRILPESVDDIPAIEVEAKGQGWSHFWKVYGLQKQQDSTKGLIEEVPASIKRKAEISIQDGIEAKRVRTQNGLQVSDSFSDVSQEDQDAGDFVVVKGEEEEEEICIAPDVALFEDPKSKPVRLDVFLTEDFRERICRCKGCESDFINFPYLLKAEETYSPPQSISPSQAGNDDAQSEGGASQTSSSYDLGLAALQKMPRAQMLKSLEDYKKMRDALYTHLRPYAESGKVVDGESMREFFRKQKEKDSSL